MANQTFLAPWGSTGVNNADNVPIAVFDDILHMGLPGYGVVRKDLTNGEILLPLVENSDVNGIEILPNDNVYALISDGSALYIGADDGAVKWDGIQSLDFAGRGQSWVTQPDQFFDFTLLGNDIYVGTDRGVCKYPTATVVVDDCQNVYDGMPDWSTYSVGTDGSQIYGGTNNGVGILTANPFEVVDTWEASEDTDNAPVEVIGDIAYVGLNGVGIARYEISTNSWLSTWTEDDVLDDGNQFVTGLVADINPDQLLVEGVKKYTIDLKLNAKFKDLLSFLRELEFQENIILFKDINLELSDNTKDKNSKNKPTVLAATLKIIVYGKI